MNEFINLIKECDKKTDHLRCFVKLLKVNGDF